MQQDNPTRCTSRRVIWRFSREGWQSLDDLLPTELPTTIYLNGRELVTLLCSPEHLEDLAVGFLVGEGLLHDPHDLESVLADYDRGQVWVTSRAAPLVAEKTFMKRYLTTGCSKGTTFYSLDDSKRAASLEQRVKIEAEHVSELMRSFQERSELFRSTGGVHSAALCDSSGIVIYREDLGRHNALDKLVGCCLRQGIDRGRYFLIYSGRISSEILLKTVKAGIEILVSRSAPTSLAVELAERLGITVIGFAREARFNVYSHPERVEK